MSDAVAQEQIDFAGALADAARPVVRRHFRTSVPVDSKADSTPVTIADREAETVMRRLIEQRYPDHGVIGEEHGAVRERASHVWVLDPIDGTKAFIAGKPLFGTLIALVRDGTPVIGIIDQPVLDERWLGAAGRPTHFNGAPARTRACPALDRATLSTTSPDLFGGADAIHFRALAARTGMTHYGGDCYGYGLLASGHIDLVVEAGLKPYDYCALIPVIEGAGGVVTDWRGRRVGLDSDGRIAAAGDPALLPGVIEALNGQAEVS